MLTQAALQAPMFETRWRWNARRALALLRRRGGKKVPPNLQRMRAQDLLAAVFPGQTACQDNHGGGPIEVPDHPLVDETVRDCLVEATDAAGLQAMLTRLHAGEIRRLARDVAEPSPFSHEILNANPYTFLDDAPLEERRSRAVSVRRGLPARDRGRAWGRSTRRRSPTWWPRPSPAWPAPTSCTTCCWTWARLPEARGDRRAAGRRSFETLVAERRAARAAVARRATGSGRFWVAAERRSLAALAWPGGALPARPGRAAAAQAAAPGPTPTAPPPSWCARG